MLFNKLHAFFKKHRSSFATPQVDHDSALPYRIVTTCRNAEVVHLEELMRSLLGTYDVTYQPNEPAVQSHLVAITVEVMCSVRERAGLVQLVTRLAQEISVRSVRWESIPKRSERPAQIAYEPSARGNTPTAQPA